MMIKERVEYEEWRTSEGFTEKWTHMCYTCGLVNPSQRHMDETCPNLTEREKVMPMPKRRYETIPCSHCGRTGLKLERSYKRTYDNSWQTYRKLKCYHCGNVEDEQECTY